MLLLGQRRGLGVCRDPQETEDRRLTAAANCAGALLWVKGWLFSPSLHVTTASSLLTCSSLS